MKSKKILRTIIFLSVFLLFSYGNLTMGMKDRGKTQKLTKKLREESGRGDLSKVKELIIKGADFRDEHYLWGSSITNATCGGHLPIVKYLIDQKGIKANYVSLRSSWNLLHMASQKGHLDIVEYLILKGAKESINKKNSDWGCTALHYAAQQKKSDILKVLVENGGDINAGDKDDWTPLHYAATKGSLESVEYLISKGAKVDAKNKSGKIPFDIAVKELNTGLVEFFLKSGLHNLSYEDQYKELLFESVRKANLFVVKTLVEGGADVNVRDSGSDEGWEYSYPLLYKAADSNNLEIVKYLVEKGANIYSKNHWGDTPIYAAASGGYLDIVKYFAEECCAKIDLRTNYGGTLLGGACHSGHTDVVRYLMAKGASVGPEELNRAVWKNRVDVVKLLVENGADYNSKGGSDYTPMEYAARKSHLEILNYFMENEKNKRSITYYIPKKMKDSAIKISSRIFSFAKLSFAKQSNMTGFLHNFLDNMDCKYDLEIVKYFIQNGADINSKDKDGKTPLYKVALGNYSEDSKLNIVKYLIENGANIKVRTSSGNTLLHGACSRFNLEVARYLIENGEDVNVPNKNLNTPLHKAAKSGNSKLVKCLIENGAKVNAKNKDGRTPMQLYLHKNEDDTKTGGVNYKLLEIFFDHMASIDVNDILVKYVFTRAAHQAQAKVFDYLLKNKINVNWKDDDGMSALHYAASNSDLELVKKLVENGADINVKSSGNVTPIFYAVLNKNFKIIKYLVKNGAEINSKNEQGCTMLFHAIWWEDLDLIKLLVECGAEINIKATDSKTPLSNACRKSNFAIVKYLVENGADICHKHNDGSFWFEAVRPHSFSTGFPEMVESYIREILVNDLELKNQVEKLKKFDFEGREKLKELFLSDKVSGISKLKFLDQLVEFDSSTKVFGDAFLVEFYKGIRFNFEIFKYKSAYNLAMSNKKIKDASSRTIEDFICQVSKNYKNPFKEKICSICCEDFKNGEIISVTPCKHPYHSHCILGWIVQNNKESCPICKEKVQENSLATNIFLSLKK